jgi:hypothetical protein
MINEIDLDTVISELRVELDRIDRAIVVFERLSTEKKPSRRKRNRPDSVRASREQQPTANPC